MKKVYPSLATIVKPWDNCSGCRICEVVCSTHHEGVCNPNKARINVVSMDKGKCYPVVCSQCAAPKCAQACSVGAIKKNETIGAYIVSEDECIGCGACVQACPFGAIKLHPEKGIAIKCDLCLGDPECVKACPPKLLQIAFDKSNPAVVDKRKRYAAASVKSELQKR